ncbi:MAG TPA: aldo/keto reductase [Ktedonobacteraceae bacterium]|jgi:aryl-alcohol dehydrogenase-like predicted oxidoreductase|nr:aldo/keto reductase [Ktedonobacteraceae bacterium]
MEVRELGNTGMQIAPIGLGTWAIGGEGWAKGWGPQDDNDSIATIHRAIDLGVNWIDTAAIYGVGHAEEVVGRALKGRAERPFVFTKGGRVATDDGIQGVLKGDSIRKEVEASLRRLQIDAIDLYQIHWPQPDQDIEGAWEAMVDLQQQGKIRYLGVSNFNVSQMDRLQAIAPISSLQPPYSLLKRGIEDAVLDYCQEHAIGVIAYAPMASGILTGKMTRERLQSMPESDWRRHDSEFTEPRLTRNLALVDQLRVIGAHHKSTPAQVAVAWVLRHPAVTGAIVGGRHPEQIETIIGAANLTLDDADIAALEDFLEKHP